MPAMLKIESSDTRQFSLYTWFSECVTNPMKTRVKNLGIEWKLV